MDYGSGKCKTIDIKNDVDIIQSVNNIKKQIKLLANIELNATNLIKAIDAYDMPVFKYSFAELEETKNTTRTTLI